MPSKKPQRTVAERALDAEVRSSQWLADGNEANEAGQHEKAERCYAKSQYWLDRANHLRGFGDRPPPKR